MDGFQTLLVDGYISRTFRSQAAEQYFLNLLKTTAIPPEATLPLTRRNPYFFFVYPVPPHIPPRSLNPPVRWVLDRCIAEGGTVVPQTMWSPDSPVARRQNIEKALLQMPIFFEDKDGGVGLPLGASIDGGCHILRDADDLAPLGPKTTTHIRIVWPGYKHFKRQIPIRDESIERNTITMARFLCQVGRSVDAFLQVCEVDTECVDDRCRLWQIGPGGVQRSDIIIIGAVHISAGSWMPIMQLNRYIF
ncbi:hypothetical protein EI94DRAFT_909773 [Lactarius quietus]|nr:hypothetical protein EI94DRAFT_909773 [Lactarius quietus]